VYFTEQSCNRLNHRIRPPLGETAQPKHLHLNMSVKYNGCLPPLFRMIIAGSSGKGKTTLIRKIIENANGILEKDFTRIILLRGVETNNEQILRKKLGANLITFDGIPHENVILPLLKGHDTDTTLLLIEDLDADACNSNLISKIFTAYSHHLGFSVILSTQNIFRPGRERLTLFRNASHLVLFSSDLDESLIRLVAQKVHTKDPQKITSLFESLTNEIHGYLSIWTNCPKELKFRSNITGEVQHVYI